MPAAAVIPASAASIKVAAVKRLAVECQCRALDRWTLERGIQGRVGAFTGAASLPQVPVRYKPPRSRTYRGLLGWCLGATLKHQCHRE